MLRLHRHHHEPPAVQSVTSAPESLTDEQSARMRRYLLTMGIRTVCFVLAVVTATREMHWLIWGGFALLAVVLPYVAVVMANAVSPRQGGGTGPVTPRDDGPEQIGR